MSIAFISSDRAKCDSCGVPTLVSMLDAKPWANATSIEMRGDAAASVNWDRLECQTCYGRDWRPM